jgi:hypothetical protein
MHRLRVRIPRNPQSLFSDALFGLRNVAVGLSKVSALLG